MEGGFSRLNALTIIQTSQGLAAYLLSRPELRVQERGIVLGFDGRHNSPRFPFTAIVVLMFADTHAASSSLLCGCMNGYAGKFTIRYIHCIVILPLLEAIATKTKRAVEECINWMTL